MIGKNTKVNYVHVKAPDNWVNDPNGFIYYKGMYHLFYQYYPYAPRWDTMHWGHAVSRDLIHWEHVGIAMFPSTDGDRDGCFSGSAVEHDGRMYLMYTGVRFIPADPKDPQENGSCVSTQMMIASEDGFHFDNAEGKYVVIPAITDPAMGSLDTRDPKIWRGSDGWYAVLGTRTQKEGDQEPDGKLLFYKSTDLYHWTYMNSVTKKGMGVFWECPDYFETEGGAVVMASPIKLFDEKDREGNHGICMTADFDESTCTMTLPDHYQLMDYGMDLYAAQSTVDAKGRRMLVAWLRMSEPVDGRWIGMFCMPRLVEVVNGHVYFRIHPDILKAYCVKIESPAQALDGEYYISTDMEDGDCLWVGGYKIYRCGQQICTDRSAVYPQNPRFGMQAASPKLQDGFHLDVFVSSNCVEVFINHGEYVITHGVFGLSCEVALAGKAAPELFTLAE